MKYVKIILKYILAVAFVQAGINHFLNPQFYMKMMPPVLPAHLFLIYLSGVFEILFGVLLFIPRFSRLAAWLIIVLLIAVFPANIYMAINPQLFPDITQTALYIRLPLQIVLIAWAFWFTKKEKSTSD